MKQHQTWRDIARETIQKALDEAKAQGLDTAGTRTYVNSKYPFGARAYHPYKIWLSEMKRTFEPGARPASRDLEKLAAWNAGEPIR